MLSEHHKQFSIELIDDRSGLCFLFQYLMFGQVGYHFQQRCTLCPLNIFSDASLIVEL